MLLSTQIYCTQVISICTKCENTSINWLQFLTISRGPNIKANSRELQADRRCFLAQTAEVQGEKPLQPWLIIPHMIKIRTCSSLTDVFLIQCFTVSVLFFSRNPDFQDEFVVLSPALRLGQLNTSELIRVLWGEEALHSKPNLLQMRILFNSNLWSASLFSC